MCSKALALIRSVIIDSRRTKTAVEVLTELDPSVLMLITNPENEINSGQNAEMEIKQAELMQLFQEMIKIPALKKKIMQSFSEHAMRKLFSHVLDNEFSAAGDWTGNFIQVNTEFNTEYATRVTFILNTYFQLHRMFLPIFTFML